MYVLGYCISRYPFQWHFETWAKSMSDLELEMLCKGMTGSAECQHAGKFLEGCFSDSNITAEGIKWFVKIPVQLAQHINDLNFGFNQLDRNALSIFCEMVPELTHLHNLSLIHNSIGQGGAVKLLKCLFRCKTPLKTLNLEQTGVGERDCAELALLIANTINRQV